MRYTIWPLECRAAMACMDADSIDSIVTDPPYGLSKEPDVAEVMRHWLAGDDYQHTGSGFMGKSWDSFVPGPAVWREAYRVLKPGGHLVAFFGTRTYDLGVMALRLAGFEVRDQLAWVYGCLDEETEAATSDGVKPYHKINAGDLVLCYDAATGGYSYQPVQEVVVYDYEDTAYRLIGDFGEQVVSRNHRCIVERDGRETFVYAESLQPQERVPVLESLPALQQAVCDQPGPQEIRGWGGHRTTMVRVVPFQKRGKVWCLRVPTGAFVAVRGGVAFPTGNSGFPKSHDVSKGIDKAAGVERTEVVGSKLGRPGMAKDGSNQRNGFDGAFGGEPSGAMPTDILAPATPEAEQWQGWGTALKPALEPIVLARKPLSEKTVAANVLRWGTGAINVDACRVEGSEDTSRPQGKDIRGGNWSGDGGRSNLTTGGGTGRWPANFTHDGSEEVLAHFPVTGPSSGVPRNNGAFKSHSKGAENPHVTQGVSDAGGSAARFFYCPKASKADRNRGLDDATAQPSAASEFRPNHAEKAANGEDGNPYGRFKPLKNFHPTVKPTTLMQWLCRMVTPPGGVVLDPFMGSGSTGVACMLEGFQFIGCEMTEEYLPIAEARIASALQP